jgi:hypothetical protein
VHDDLGAMPAEFFGRRPADARSGPGDQGADAVEVSLFVHLLSFRIDLPRHAMSAVSGNRGAATW